MSSRNRALWIKKKQDPVMVVEDAPYSTPGADEVVIKVKAVAINPADWIIQRVGVLVQQYPAILGCDAAGVIEEVGPNVKDFKPGDRVIGLCGPLNTKNGVYSYAAFQQYVVLKLPLLTKIPDQAEFRDAVVLPLGINTAASCLFDASTLGLLMPPSDAGNGKTLLIFGGSGSVGSCGVQLARAAGYEVLGIASQHNHEFVKSVGATACFDQKEPDLIDKLVSFLKDKDVVGAYDAVANKETLNILCDVLDGSGGRKLVVAVTPGSEAHAAKGVRIVTNFGANIAQSEVGPHIFNTFLESALLSGRFQYKPTAEVVGERLEDIQEACDMLSRGVSAKKLVVTL